jgi:alanyl-tRNA synthetase
MKTDELRTSFLDYFRSKGHKEVLASPLPIDDPTLMFTIAGMVPLKKYFLGEEEPPNTRLTSVQRCLRTNDIEKVGKTPRHHTFFEMLGNFSIGDYFKDEAIALALEFLTNNIALPLERIWISVYPEDLEAKSIWKKLIPQGRIIESKENFWQMAQTGPAGYDSEIYFDLGEDVGCRKPDCSPNCECGRFVELWNLVFTEFNLEKDGNLKPLPKKNIDTGMGLERLSAAVNGVKSNFDIDIFNSILERVEELSKKNRSYERDRFNLIADHARAITFLVADGVFPENQRHGYVLRRLIRRTKLSGYLLGIDMPFIFNLCSVVINTMGNYYTYLNQAISRIDLVVNKEEEQFNKTLKEGLRIFNEEKKKTTLVFSGDVAFKLHDTFGFPVSLTKEMLEAEGMKLDEERFNYLYEEQIKRAKRESNLDKTLEETDYWIQVRDSIGKTEFLGYETSQTKSVVKGIVKDNISFEKLSKIDNSEIFLILDKTPFFSEKGGPVGDKGIIEGNHFKFKVTNTFSPVADLIIHKGILLNGEICLEDEVLAKVSEEFRKGIKRAHTSTHLLHYALKKVIGEYTNQAGSLVDSDYLRFDFNAFKGLDYKELAEIEDIVNDAIENSYNVETKEMPYSKALSEGATALFKEKYGETVRVVSIDEISKELCAGIHVKNTLEIRVFKILKEGSIGSNLRRIEAVCGNKAYLKFKEDSHILNNLKELLNNPNIDILDGVKALIEENKEKTTKIRTLEKRLMNYVAEETLNEGEAINGIKFIYKSFKNSEIEYLRNLADLIKEKSKGQTFIILGNAREGSTNLIITGSKEFDFQKVLVNMSEKFAIKGGGKGNLIQTGSINSDSIGGIIDYLKRNLVSFLINEEK